MRLWLPYVAGSRESGNGAVASDASASRLSPVGAVCHIAHEDCAYAVPGTQVDRVRRTRN